MQVMMGSELFYHKLLGEGSMSLYMQAELLQELSDAIVQHEKKCWPWCGHHTISDLIFREGNLYCELTIVHCSGFIVSKSRRARCQDGWRGWLSSTMK